MEQSRSPLLDQTTEGNGLRPQDCSIIPHSKAKVKAFYVNFNPITPASAPARLETPK